MTLGDADRGRIVTCVARAANAGGMREQQARPVGPVTAADAAGAAIQAQDSVVRLPRPTAAITHSGCARRRCRLTVLTNDTSRQAAKARVTMQRVGARGARPVAVRRLTARIFSVVTGRLRAGRCRFTVTATNASGAAAAPVSVVLTVTRR
jgi:hypothetical protein